MKYILILITIFVYSCISNEGGIFINSDVAGSNPAISEGGGQPNSGSEEITQSNMTDLLFDFTDPTELEQNFNLTTSGSPGFTQTAINPLTSYQAMSCTSTSSTYKGCYQESNTTFNLPIIIEFDFVMKNAWYTCSTVGLAFYENVSSFHPNFSGFPMTGINLGRISWGYTYTNDLGDLGPSDNRTFMVVSNDFLGDIRYYESSQRIPSEGKLKLEIDANGAFTYSFIATDRSVINTQNGQLSSIPTNFKIRFYQTNYGDGSAHSKRFANYPSFVGYSNIIDNIKISYE